MSPNGDPPPAAAPKGDPPLPPKGLPELFPMSPNGDPSAPPKGDPPKGDPPKGDPPKGLPELLCGCSERFFGPGSPFGRTSTSTFFTSSTSSRFTPSTLASASYLANSDFSK